MEYTVESGQAAARYIVLNPADVPSSTISLPPNSPASLDNRIPYFSGTEEYFTICDTFLMLLFIFDDPAPRSRTEIVLLPEIFFFLISSIIKTTPGSILFLNTLDTR